MKLAIGYVDACDGPRCHDVHGLYSCTRPLDHKTKHLATGIAGTDGAPPEKEPVYAEWANKNGIGFAKMDPARQRHHAIAGGLASRANENCHRFTVEQARAAGRKGGAVRALDRDGMAEIGRKGGKVTAQTRRHMAEIGGKGGSSVSDGPNGKRHMSEIGKRGAAARRAKGNKIDTI